jgi:hypothetical protein
MNNNNNNLIVNIKNSIGGNRLDQSLKNKMQFQTNAEERISPTKLNNSTSSSSTATTSSSSNTVLELETNNDEDGNDLNKNNLLNNSKENDNDEVNYSSLNNQNVLIEKSGGLSNKHVLIILLLWYLFSAFTLFTNKYLVSNGGDPTLLGKYFLTYWIVPNNDIYIEYRCHSNDHYKSLLFYTN